MSKSKKSITVEIPVKWIKGDKVWIIEEDSEYKGDECDKCGQCDYTGAYSIAEAKVIGHAFTTDEEGQIVCAGYQLSWRKRKEYMPAQYIYNTDDDAAKALTKLLNGDDG